MFNRFVFVSLGLFILIPACSTIQNQDGQFEDLANNYIEKFLKMNPVWATSLGDHRYDDIIDDYSLEGINNTLQFNRSYLDSLNAMDKNKLSETNRIDYQILRSNIKYTIFRLDTLREYEWNPRVYNIGSAIYSLVARDFAPLRERLQNVKKRLLRIIMF